MASPAPLLRPPIPGAGRQQSKAPRLGLAIPPSPNQRPVNSTAAPPMADNSIPPLAIPSRQQQPKLTLATPMGSNQTPQENAQGRMRGPPLKIGTGSGQSSDDSAHSRTNSFGNSTQNGSVSTASSAYSALNFADMLKDPQSATSSARSVGMERENSMQGILPDLEQLSLEKGRALDVEDLDDLGWKAAKKEGRIVELGSLGEGAGGAVTRCILKGGKTVFALKV